MHDMNASESTNPPSFMSVSRPISHHSTPSHTYGWSHATCMKKKSQAGRTSHAQSCHRLCGMTYSSHLAFLWHDFFRNECTDANECAMSHVDVSTCRNPRVCVMHTYEEVMSRTWSHHLSNGEEDAVATEPGDPAPGSARRMNLPPPPPPSPLLPVP